MFESDADDYDQILSQLDLPEVTTKAAIKTVPDSSKICDKPTPPSNITTVPLDCKLVIKSNINKCESVNNDLNVNTSKVASRKVESKVSPKHTKRKIINSYFNHTSKRKFPGPAGLLNDSFKENEDDSVCLQELLSQDLEFSQNCIPRDAFDSPLWKRLLEDVKSLNMGAIDTIVGIKQPTADDVRWKKAGIVAAFIEAVDRSNTDPLITLRDVTGNIKCTLHREAWAKFSSYLVPEYCALVLSKPTVLMMGTRAIKNHHLNITMSNISAIYSSAVLEDDNKEELDGCEILCEKDFTVIKLDKSSVNEDKNATESPNPDAFGLLDGLDSIFSDDIF